MAIPHPMLLSHLLSKKDTVILDGALGTELEARGCNLSKPLWSANALLEQPSVVQAVHEAYFRAGADVVITASYQTSPQGLACLGIRKAEACSIIQQSVHLAEAARDSVHAAGVQRELLVAGSVGPYGAYLADGSEYHGDYQVSKQLLREFHEPRLRALLDGGIRLFAFETMPSALEVRVLLALLEGLPESVEAWFSFTLKDASHLSDGVALTDIIPVLDDSTRVVAVGVNCVPPDLVAPALEHLSAITTKPLLAYPNSGEDWNAAHQTWVGGRQTSLAPPSVWRSLGARVIGGCCRTGPKDIEQIASTFVASHPPETARQGKKGAEVNVDSTTSRAQ